MFRLKIVPLLICLLWLWPVATTASTSVPVHAVSADDLNAGPVSLAGLWAFDWKELHLDARRPMQDGVMLPGLWHHQGPYDREGYGTFRAVVTLPKFQPHFLYIPDAPSALAVWINGQQVYRRGVVASEASFEKPEFGPDVVKLPPADEYEIVVHVSNYHHKEGGMWHRLRIADEAHKHLLMDRAKLIEAMIFTFLLSVSFYLLVTHWQRKRRLPVFLFVGFLWAIAGRAVMVGERIAYDVLNLSWLTQQRLEHALLWLALPLFVFYMHSVFALHRKLAFRLWAYFLVFITAVMLAIISFTDTKVFAYTGQVFQIAAAITSLYCLVVLVVLNAHGVAKSHWFLASFAGFLVMFVHDILYTNLWIQSRPMAQFGILFFVAMQSYLLWQTRFREHRMVRYVRLAIEQRIDHIAQLIQRQDAHKAWLNQDVFLQHSLPAEVMQELQNVPEIDRRQNVGVREIVAQVRPYFDVMRCKLQVKLRASAVHNEAQVVADANWLQQVLLCLGRVGEDTGLGCRLWVSDSKESVLIRLMVQGNVQPQGLNGKLLDWLLSVVARMGSQLCIQHGRNRTHVYFKLPLVGREAHQPNQVVVTGAEGAPVILVQAPQRTLYETSLADHYQLVFAPATVNHINRFRPSLVLLEGERDRPLSPELMETLRMLVPQLPIVVVLPALQKLQLAELIRKGASDYMVSPLVQEEILLKVQGRVMRSEAEPRSQVPMVETGVDLRELTVQLIRNCIQLWQSYTGRSKADLAEHSKLWRVYLDGSTAKTRTLDKYLSLQSLPKKPRWDTVSRTALFVMEHCALSEDDREQLQQQLQRLQQQLAL